MSRTPKNRNVEKAEVGIDEIEKSIQAWASSKDGGEKLRAAQKSAKAAAEYVDAEVGIDPALLHQSVTL